MWLRVAREPFLRFCDGSKTAEARNLRKRNGHLNGTVTPFLKPAAKGEEVRVANGYSKNAPVRVGVVGRYWIAGSWGGLPQGVMDMVNAKDPSKFIRLDEPVVVVEITGCRGDSR